MLILLKNVTIVRKMVIARSVQYVPMVIVRPRNMAFVTKDALLMMIVSRDGVWVANVLIHSMVFKLTVFVKKTIIVNQVIAPMEVAN